MIISYLRVTWVTEGYLDSTLWCISLHLQTDFSSAKEGDIPTWHGRPQTASGQGKNAFDPFSPPLPLVDFQEASPPGAEREGLAHKASARSDILGF